MIGFVPKMDGIVEGLNSKLIGFLRANYQSEIGRKEIIHDRAIC
jgi:hypothetical protein